MSTTDVSGPNAAGREFVTALMAGDAVALRRVLSEDFTLIDVMTGTEVPGAVLSELVGSGRLAFDSIEATVSRVRLYQATAVVTGQSRMFGRMGDARFFSNTRYTNVYVEQGGRWRLVSAQGTEIVDDEAEGDAG
ncbi:MAG TPA: nuclear transport factor 2 family protein [Gemmatimonadaceae bacterium]|nr:nuclear transport factor 2 family protein [Gemmatimonadaceae bacterium]